MANFKFFTSSISTLEELRKQYKNLLKLHHPDNGGTKEASQKINNEYEQLFNMLKAGYTHARTETRNKESVKTDWTEQTDEALREALQKIIHLQGIEIEICGSWIWVSGNTYSVKAEIKSAGYKWSKNKSMWYFHNGEYRRGSRKTYTMDDIRFKYGSTEISGKPQAALA
ncbi:MAG: J domain-containing protein [Lachnospiraceae bacterium]